LRSKDLVSSLDKRVELRVGFLGILTHGSGGVASVTNRAAVDSREGGASLAGEGLELRAGLRDADFSRQDVFAEGANSLAQATVAAAGAMGGSDTADVTGCQFVVERVGRNEGDDKGQKAEDVEGDHGERRTER